MDISLIEKSVRLFLCFFGKFKNLFYLCPMNNKITIDLDEIRKLPDDSIMDVETIRQIALSKDKTLYSKVKTGYEVYGLYPEVMNSFEIKKFK